MSHTPVVGVHLVLVEGGKVLLGRRANTSFAEGFWHTPAGHLEAGESVLRGMVREAEEELGIRIREEDLVLVHTLHHLDADDGLGRLQLFFTARSYRGPVTNREPDKCSELKYWPLEALPDTTVAYTAAALAEIAAGRPLSVLGWPTTATTSGPERAVSATAVGSPESRLVVVRGNSASGKSSVADGLREAFGRGLAIVGQDNLRRVVLRERDRHGGANIGLIDTTARYALNAGYHVVVEGILSAERYGPMLQRLVDDHAGVTRCYYLDVPFEETLRRHATKQDPQLLANVTEQHLREWYRERDLLPGGVETVIGADSTLAATVELIMRDIGLDIPPTQHTQPGPSAVGAGTTSYGRQGT